MTNERARQILLTLDGLGRQAKLEALELLLKDAYDRGYRYACSGVVV
jgi:hypothetical protein